MLGWMGVQTRKLQFLKIKQQTQVSKSSEVTFWGVYL